MRALLLGAALLSACDSPTVPERLLRDVYDYRLLTPEPRVLRWPSGSTVRVYVEPAAEPARTAALQAALQSAIPAWNAAALYGEVRLEETTDVANADVVMLYSGTLAPVDVSACSPGGGQAYTTFCLSDDANHLKVFPLRNSPTAGNVKFLLTVRTTTVLNAEEVRRLVAHELGHVLGIGQHSPTPTDLMYAGVLTRAEPNAADRRTLQVLYHTEPDITP
jgi:predicted Zn-dependent protease